MAGHIEPRDGSYADSIGFFCRVVVPVTGGRGGRRCRRIVIDGAFDVAAEKPGKGSDLAALP